MKFDDLENLSSAVLSTDLIHALKINESNSVLLSYKAFPNALSSVFESTSLLKTIEDKIIAIKLSADALFRKFPTKQWTDNAIASKETLNNITPSLLTYDAMNSMLEKYVNETNLKEKGATARQEALKLADEMTDFVGAALVGINQSGGGSGELSG